MIAAFPIYQPPQQIASQKTEVVFDESNVRDGLVKVDRHAWDYFAREKFRQEAENTDRVYLRQKLYELRGLVESETPFTSSISDVVENSHFRRIVDQGPKMIPVILEELARRPSYLVWALNFLTGMRISEKTVSLEEASALWIKWGKKHKLA